MKLGVGPKSMFSLLAVTIVNSKEKILGIWSGIKAQMRKKGHFPIRGKRDPTVKRAAQIVMIVVRCIIKIRQPTIILLKIPRIQ
jgi:hypothetical protein